MKINAQEILLLNKKNMKFGSTTTQSTSAPIAEPPVSKPDSTMNALNAKAQNNIAFQGLNLTASYKKAIAPLVLAAAAFLATSCTEDPIEIKYPDYNKEDITNISITVTNDYSALLSLFERLAASGELSAEELTKLNAAFAAYYKDWQADQAADAAFYQAVVDYMMADQTIQNKMYDALLKQGKSEEEATKIMENIFKMVEEGKYKEALTEITKLLSSIDITVKGILAEVKNLRADIKDIKEGQGKQIDLMGAFFEQNEYRNEKLDSLNKSVDILNIKADNVSNTINKLLEIAKDPNRYNELIAALKAESSEIQELFKMFGFDISTTLREIEKDQEKGQNVIIGQLGWIQAFAEKAYCKSTKDLATIIKQLNFLSQKVPNINKEDIEKAFEELKGIKDAVDKNTEVTEDSANKIGDGIANLGDKIDNVLAKMDQMIADFGKYAKESLRYQKYYNDKFNLALAGIGNVAEILKLSQATQEQILEEVKAAEGHQKTAIEYLKSSNEKQDKLIEIAQQLVDAGNGGMTIDEYKAYMEERDAKNLEIFEQYLIESGYAELPGTTTEIRDLLEEIKNDKQNTVDYSNQLSTIIGLLYEIKNLDPTSPDYSDILNEISEKITEWKCNCECGNNASNNEGILGDLENKLS